jgi:outer membrane protein assembly factor BamB
MCIVDGRLFTQEQRGGKEAVVCVDAGTGAEVWSHEEDGRFWDTLSSAGPRGTPTFSEGKVYAQGATGTLVCLEAGSGRKVWSRDVLADGGGKLPDWGVSSSPLVTNGVVIVFGAGQGGKGLVGYRADSGEVAWTLDWGVVSYSSAQLATIGGVEQVLFIGDAGLVAVEGATGKKVWEYGAAGQPPRSLQPCVVDGSRVLVPLGMEAPTDLIEVVRGGEGYSVKKVWTSKNLKPSFNDFVVHVGHVYGFDVAIFSCVELGTGARKWKKGRYGTGQVLLLADQGLLLVLSDQGKVVLVRARADAFEEVGEFQAIEGKTWNHPVVVGGKLYVRNAAEMACFEVGKSQ